MKIFLIILSFLAPSSWGQTSPADNALKIQSMNTKQQALYHKLGDALRCPTCSGLSVLQSDAPFSLQIKAKTLDLVTEGKDYDEVLAYFTHRYGDWILRSPPSHGLHLWMWLLPILAACMGIIFLSLRYWLKPRRTTPLRSTEDIHQEMLAEIAKRREVL